MFLLYIFTGWFFDITGSYDASFYIAGGLICISGVMCFPLKLLSNWELKRAKQLFLESKCPLNLIYDKL